MAKRDAACQEAREFCLESKEPTSVETESVAGHEEVPKEEAAVKTVRTLKERYGDRYLAVGRRREPKKRTQGDGGCRKKLVAAHRPMTRRAIPSRLKGHKRQGSAKEQGTPKGPAVGKRRRPRPECSNGIRDRDSKEQVRPSKERTSGRIFGKELEVSKQIVGTAEIE
jgi:hypothetical protein